MNSKWILGWFFWWICGLCSSFDLTIDFLLDTKPQCHPFEIVLFSFDSEPWVFWSLSHSLHSVWIVIEMVHVEPNIFSGFEQSLTQQPEQLNQIINVMKCEMGKFSEELLFKILSLASLIIPSSNEIESTNKKQEE